MKLRRRRSLAVAKVMSGWRRRGLQAWVLRCVGNNKYKDSATWTSTSFLRAGRRCSTLVSKWTTTTNGVQKIHNRIRQRADVLADDRAGLCRRKVTQTTRTGFLSAPDSVATPERSQIQRCTIYVHELPPRLTPSEQTTSPRNTGDGGLNHGRSMGGGSAAERHAMAVMVDGMDPAASGAWDR
uniref:Uncharacterized protein n=1 Tax=Oryza nivara TaxID=4536 RepID=A0A0E0G8X5_ORYNI